MNAYTVAGNGVEAFLKMTPIGQEIVFDVEDALDGVTFFALIPDNDDGVACIAVNLAFMPILV